ncbi:MAG: HIT family protein [Anaerolineae bacterium]
MGRDSVASNDFYCDEVLSGRTLVCKVLETENVLAFQHTRPYWAVHIVVIPKRHVPSLLELGVDDIELLVELMPLLPEIDLDAMATGR